ncbi:hypothetical protein [Weissella confusa]|uniref:hypothetical protein n=1 Tax=Weissella confusa TaxID=1583 RepID=UPI0022FDF28B|nr:hypothetical protein [Weissella confusa]
MILSKAKIFQDTEYHFLLVEYNPDNQGYYELISEQKEYENIQVLLTTYLMFQLMSNLMSNGYVITEIKIDDSNQEEEIESLITLLTSRNNDVRPFLKIAESVFLENMISINKITLLLDYPKSIKVSFFESGIVEFGGLAQDDVEKLINENLRWTD